MTIDYIAINIGYFILGISLLSLFIFSCVGVCLLSNRLQTKLMETLGGWKVFYEFRDWYHNVREKEPE